MIPKDARIFISFHPDNEKLVQPLIEQARTDGWSNFDAPDEEAGQADISESIRQCGIALIFLSKAYARDDCLMLEQFAYTATVMRKPFIPVWLDDIEDIRKSFQGGSDDIQLLSALEMLTAKYPGTTAGGISSALERYTPEERPYMPSTPQICDKPCEAYEGGEPYIFISYAHDDAPAVYPVVKELYESGWDLWYDEGIKTTERYLPVIADNLKRCAVFVLMLTNRCLDRPFVIDFELEFARRRGIPIIPVLLEELSPQSWSKDTAERLLNTAITPGALLEAIGAMNLPNRGAREAVPPAIKHNMVYDIVLPPDLPGFEYAAQGDTVIITKYTGDDTEIVVPGKVTTPDGSKEFQVAVGEGAFAYRSSLTSVILSEGITDVGPSAFLGCEKLESVIIPDGVTALGEGAFRNCTALKSINIPDSATGISDVIFGDCPQLGVVLAQNQTVLCHYPDDGSCDIPNGVKLIIGAFVGGKTLTHITMPSGVASIGNRAFYECESLESIALPDSVTSIGESAFQGCKSLKNIAIPDGVTSIGESAFSWCKSLESITIPNSVTNIGESAFQGCESLKNIAIPDGVTSIGKSAFEHCESLESIAIPNSVTSIGESAFEYCKSLKSITIPNGVTSIGESVFQYCSLLKSLTIPDGVTSIGESAFLLCESLKSITIPNSVASIGEDAFAGCGSLESITIPNSVASIGRDAFRDTKLEPDIYNRLTAENNQKAKPLTPSGRPAQPVFSIPQAKERPRALICCAKEDIGQVGALLAGLYWEGFNFYHNETPGQEDIGENPCFLAFLSEHTAKSRQTIEAIKLAINRDVSRIVQVFLGDCTEWPEDVRDRLHDRQAVIQKLSSEQEFTGKIRDSLRQFNCVLGHPRGFDIKKAGGAVISRFHDAGYPHVIIPKTFFFPPLPVTGIGDGAFEDCDQIKSVTIPESVTSVGKRAFSWCMSLENIALPDSVTSIGESAFQGCKSLKNIALPDGVTSIGESDFKHCESLESITIPNSVTNIGESVFQGCKSLKNIVIPDNVTSIGNSVFQRCESLESITIPDDVTNIGNMAFDGCKSLESITIPSGVEALGDMAFSGCTALKSIAIPDSVTSIGERAFSWCMSLENITIPDSVTSIGKNAFWWCDSLTIYAPPGSAAWEYAITNKINVAAAEPAKDPVVEETVPALPDDEPPRPLKKSGGLFGFFRRKK